ncbi:MAG: transketolase, partial [Candidatus Eisenbacteria bacterium]|nr:transketolase [Candidatus Eisenbacteria bacterium]
ALRILSAEAVEQARSGHPGMPMGAAGMAYVLWTRFLRHDPRDPRWPDRDRFVLSAGHGSMLLYSLLHLSGYDLTLEEIRRFRQWGSLTPGHPEYGRTPGVETTTGPLGQGFANAVGMAMAERFLAGRFNRPGRAIVDHRTYVLAGDGDLMEGVTHEAASLAGHLRLGRLIVLYDDNRITIEGPTSLAWSDDTPARFAALGWQVQSATGEEPQGLTAAIESALADEARPSLIAVRTHIGQGSPNRQDSAKAHGEPLGEEELRLTKQALGWPLAPAFHIPEEAREVFRAAAARGADRRREWLASLEAYAREFPELKAEWDRWQSGEPPCGWREDLAAMEIPAEPTATRVASGLAIQRLARRMPNLVGGSADLGPSNNSVIAGQGSFTPGAVEGPNIHFGVREHAMAAAVNGLALHGGLRPYCATFLVFSDYMRPSLRLAALMGVPSLFLFTHDSIGVGEDGPTHQPVEHLAALRAIPGLTVIRPADARETVEAWQTALERGGPVALVLTRQKVPALARGLDRATTGEAAGAPAGARGGAPAGAVPPVARGAYILAEEPAPADGPPELILIGTGSETSLCLEAQRRLAALGIRARAVSMPSWELFDEQDEAYRHRVLPPAVSARLAVEAAVPMGWERYVGQEGAILAMGRFGASAPAEALFARFGFTVEHILELALALLKRPLPIGSGPGR